MCVCLCMCVCVCVFVCVCGGVRGCQAQHCESTFQREKWRIDELGNTLLDLASFSLLLHAWLPCKMQALKPSTSMLCRKAWSGGGFPLLLGWLPLPADLSIFYPFSLTFPKVTANYPEQFFIILTRTSSGLPRGCPGRAAQNFVIYSPVPGRVALPWPTHMHTNTNTQDTGMDTFQLTSWLRSARARVWRPTIAAVFGQHVDRLTAEAEVKSVQDWPEPCSMCVRCLYVCL